MKKFVCMICGYVHEGNEAPEACPQCKAPKAKFQEKIENGAIVFADEHRVFTEGANVRATEGGGRSVERSVFIAANGWPTLIGEGGAAHTADDTLFTKGGKDCFFHLFILAFLRACAEQTHPLPIPCRLCGFGFFCLHCSTQSTAMQP